MVAPNEQRKRAVLDAGHIAEQVQLAAVYLETAARDEWVWLEAAAGAGRR